MYAEGPSGIYQFSGFTHEFSKISDVGINTIGGAPLIVNKKTNQIVFA